MHSPVVELENLGFPPIDLEMIYQLNKEAVVQIKTPIGTTKDITIEELVRQGTVFGPLFCCASTAKVNDIGEPVKQNLGEVEVKMPVFMDDINSTTKDPENIEKAIRNCRRLEIEKKYTFGLTKTNFMVIDKDERIMIRVEETLQKGKVKEVESYKYGGIKINQDGDLKLHIERQKNTSIGICKELMGLASQREVGEEFIRVRLQLFEKSYMQSLLHGLHAWHISPEELKRVEQVQSKSLKRILELPESTPSAALFLETGIWPATERILYLTGMLYQNMIKRSDAIAPKIVKYQEEVHMENSIPHRMEEVLDYIGKSKEDIKRMQKSDWKKVLKKAMTKKITERLNNEMRGRTKSRIVIGDPFRRKKYFNKENGSLSKEIVKIRMNMYKTKSNYKTKYENLTCPKCHSNKDTTEHVVHCYTGVAVKELRNEESTSWTKIIEGFQKYTKDLEKENQNSK